MESVATEPVVVDEQIRRRDDGDAGIFDEPQCESPVPFGDRAGREVVLIAKRVVETEHEDPRCRRGLARRADDCRHPFHDLVHLREWRVRSLEAPILTSRRPEQIVAADRDDDRCALRGEATHGRSFQASREVARGGAVDAEIHDLRARQSTLEVSSDSQAGLIPRAPGQRISHHQNAIRRRCVGSCRGRGSFRVDLVAGVSAQSGDESRCERDGGDEREKNRKMPSEKAIHDEDSSLIPPIASGDAHGTRVLEASGLTKTVGARTIVEDISLEVRSGEIIGFLGPNGAGKTTTIRMLVGLIRPSRGWVRIDGFDVQSQFEAAMRRVGCIVEQPDLYRFLSGRANLEHFARMLGVPSSQTRDVAKLVGLDHRLDDKVRTYSLGMRQRLGIAQAMLGEPSVLILDEPANGLDPAGIREMRDLLRRLARDHGLGILISSHLLSEVEQICDRVTIIHRGRTLSSGTVEDLLESEVAYRLDCSPLEAAVTILEQHGLVHTLDDGEVEITTHRSAIPRIVAALVEGGVMIHGIAPRRTTLEEIFLEATHGESV